MSQAPLAEVIEIGYGSQCWNDDVTPRGNDSIARLLCSPEPAVALVNRAHSAAVSASTRAGSSGVEVAGSVLRVAGSCGGHAVFAEEFRGVSVVMRRSPKRGSQVGSD